MQLQEHNILRSNHPYRKALFDDPDYFWRWHPDTWSAHDQAARRRGSVPDVYDLQQEVVELRKELAALRAAKASHGGEHERPNVVVPRNVRRNLRKAEQQRAEHRIAGEVVA